MGLGLFDSYYYLGDFYFILFFGNIIFGIAGIVDSARRKFAKDSTKILWIIALIISTFIINSYITYVSSLVIIIYWLGGRNMATMPNSPAPGEIGAPPPPGVGPGVPPLPFAPQNKGMMAGLVIFLMTLAFAQELSYLFFSDINATNRVIAKLVMDTALIGIGVLVKNKMVGNAILYAGILRFLLIFFQLQDLDPIYRTIAMIAVVVGLIIFAIVKFGKEHEENESRTKEAR